MKSVKENVMKSVKDSAVRAKCERCEGCGEIADDDEGTPWSYWKSLPLMSAGAVLAGIVKPLPCPECSGSGRVLQ